MTRRLTLAALAVLATLAPPATAAVYSHGANLNLELCAGYRSGLEATPVPVRGLPANVVKVVAGEGAYAALTSEGTVWTCAGNSYGQAGIGHVSTPLLAPVQVPGLTGVRDIAAAGQDVLALMDDGTVKVWGGNLFGEAGNGTTTNGREVLGQSIVSPQTVPGLTGVARISGGGSVFATLVDGTVRAWGVNNHGELGLGYRSLNVTRPTLVPGLTGVVQVASRPFATFQGHTLALLNDGTVLAAGSNDFGQRGDTTTADRATFAAVKGLPPIAQVGVSAWSSLARTADGHVFSWGGDQYSQLGTGRPAPQLCPRGPCSTTPSPLPLTGVTDVQAGLGYDTALAGGQLLEWGRNHQGQLGDGRQLNVATPTPVPGLTGVTSFAAGNFHTVEIGTITPAPAPWLTSTPGPGSATLSWTAPATGFPWRLQWNGKAILIPPAARSYTVTGLAPGVLTSVYVQNRVWPHTRVAQITPTP